MKVTLLAHSMVTDEAEDILERQEGSTEAEHLITLAGRNCYKSFHRPSEATKDDRDYIRRTVLEQAHFSVAEHATATFLIEGVSRDLLGELARHRHFSFSVRSTRFVDESRSSVIDLPEFEDMGWDLVQEVEATALEAYRTGVERLLAKGYGRKQAREVARHLLPGGTQTEIVLTGNMRAFYEFLGKREAPGADKEIQRLAGEIRGHLAKLVPSMFDSN